MKKEVKNEEAAPAATEVGGDGRKDIVNSDGQVRYVEGTTTSPQNTKYRKGENEM